MVVMSISIDDKLKSQFEQCCNKEDKTISKVIRRLIKEYLSKKQK